MDYNPNKLLIIFQIVYNSLIINEKKCIIFAFKMLQNYFDKVFCINLEKNAVRWASFFPQMFINSIEIERFPAINGKEFKIEYPCKSMGNNGCTLSHYFIIERAKLIGWKSVFIFEDDAELHKDFQQIFNEAIKELPADWDMLYLGGSHREKPQQISKYIYKVTQTYTTHAIAVNHTMYDRIIKSFTSLEQPVDCYYANWQKEINAYVIAPHLAWQRGGYSDIEERDMHYPFLKNFDQ